MLSRACRRRWGHGREWRLSASSGNTENASTPIQVQIDLRSSGKRFKCLALDEMVLVRILRSAAGASHSRQHARRARSAAVKHERGVERGEPLRRFLADLQLAVDRCLAGYGAPFQKHWFVMC